MSKKSIYFKYGIIFAIALAILINIFFIDTLIVKAETENTLLLTEDIIDINTTITQINNVQNYIKNKQKLRTQNKQIAINLLKEIGYLDSFISELNEYQLLEYLNKDSFTIINSSMNETQLSNINSENLPMPMEGVETTKVLYTTVVSRNSTIRPDGRTRFTVDSTVKWKQNPANRLSDFISINWNRAEVLTANENAWYNYDMVTYVAPASYTTYHVTDYLGTADELGKMRVKRADTSNYDITNGTSFYGYANVKYDLPGNIATNGSSITYNNHVMNHTINLDSTDSFNVFSTYGHRILAGNTKLKYNKKKGWHAGFSFSIGNDAFNIIDLKAEVLK